ncbi:hypothetical protein MC7420_5866 [Coleofasciculus chthonoplastes PCC 7420]|uniref:Uncharacterized protein n=1 Tax=Coleofasciculus chthonoplastes PCC 7420 TaxID=118168 RepID=B4VW32_9CYAN|nr:hypothetical protein MC7420_5866 [Coleofasciculus chthonoplastes PCC 7420]
MLKLRTPIRLNANRNRWHIKAELGITYSSWQLAQIEVICYLGMGD